MTELSIPPSERSRKAHAAVLRAMQEPGTARNIALAMGTSESKISRIKTEHLGDSIALLCQLGFKVVPHDDVCVKREVWEAVITITARAIGNGELLRAISVEDEQ